MHYRVLHHHVRLCESRRGVSARHLPVERLVARRVFVELRRSIRRRLLRVRDRRQRLVLYVDVFQRVLGNVPALRHHHRHRVADVPNYVLRDGRVVNSLDVRVGHLPCAWNAVERSLGVRRR